MDTIVQVINESSGHAIPFKNIDGNNFFIHKGDLYFKPYESHEPGHGPIRIRDNFPTSPLSDDTIVIRPLTIDVRVQTCRRIHGKYDGGDTRARYFKELKNGCWFLYDGYLCWKISSDAALFISGHYFIRSMELNSQCWLLIERVVFSYTI